VPEVEVVRPLREVFRQGLEVWMEMVQMEEKDFYVLSKGRRRFTGVVVVAEGEAPYQERVE
jgi:hypothetical protein